MLMFKLISISKTFLPAAGAGVGGGAAFRVLAVGFAAGFTTTGDSGAIAGELIVDNFWLRAYTNATSPGLSKFEKMRKIKLSNNNRERNRNLRK